MAVLWWAIGPKVDQTSLFYQFRLDERVPNDYLLRRIDGFVTAALADMHERLRPYYSDIGRPSVDLELMIRMLIIGYCDGLRSIPVCSSRQLCRDVIETSRRGKIAGTSKYTS